MRKILLLVVLAVAAFTLWWWESPRLAAENLFDAAEDNDVAELETLIDAEKFGASLRGQSSKTAANQPLAAPTPSPALPADHLLADLVGDAQLIALRQAARTDWEIERLGFNSFRVVRRTGTGDPLPALYFERDGLHWQLVGADLTPGIAPQ